MSNATISIQKENNWYVAEFLENNVASQGRSIEEAVTNLKEALELYFEHDPDNNSVSAISQAQVAFLGVAEKLGNPTENDIQSWVDEVRYGKVN